MPSLIQDLAYKIAFTIGKDQIGKDQSPSIGAETWLGFKYFTEALDGYDRYMQSKEKDDLERVRASCLEAKKVEKDYLDLFGLFSNLALAFFNIGDYPQAEKMYRCCTELNRYDADSFNGLGAALARQDKVEDAERAYRRAIELDGKHILAYSNLAGNLIGSGRHNEAESLLDEASKLDSTDAYLLKSKGSLYQALGRYEDALGAFQKAIDLYPLYGDAWIGKGRACDSLGRYEDALGAFQKAIDLVPTDAIAWNGKGSTYHAMGQCEKALAAYKKAVELNPLYAVAQSSIAACLRKLGRGTEHAEQVKMTRNLMAKEIEYNRACFEAISGNVDEALALLQVALEKKQMSQKSARRDPDFEFIRDDPRFKALVGEP